MVLWTQLPTCKIRLRPNHLLCLSALTATTYRVLLLSTCMIVVELPQRAKPWKECSCQGVYRFYRLLPVSKSVLKIRLQLMAKVVTSNFFDKCTSGSRLSTSYIYEFAQNVVGQIEDWIIHFCPKHLCGLNCTGEWCFYIFLYSSWDALTYLIVSTVVHIQIVLDAKAAFAFLSDVSIRP